MRVLAISDVHVDYDQNRQLLAAISAVDHRDDTLILAGDATDKLDLLATTLEGLQRKFAHVLFVPGNHELWDRPREFGHAIEKFERILELCAQLGVHTEPLSLGTVWIVPLFSWYEKPEHGPDTLFLRKKAEDKTRTVWTDDFFVHWPVFDNGDSPASHFLERNRDRVARDYDAPVISFSHFLPRRDLMMRTQAEIDRDGPGIPDRSPHFNFSRVAGTHGLERQIRELGPLVHVYGHQHRDRCREVDGVLYISNCLGYPAEQEHITVTTPPAPRVVWPI